MPYLKLNVSCTLQEEKKPALYEKFGNITEKAIDRPGERCIMEFTGGHRFFYKGTPQDAAYLEIHVLGPFEFEKKAAFITAVSEFIETEFSIAKERTVINFFELPQWGRDGVILP